MGFWDLFAKPKMLRAGILKKQLYRLGKKPAEGKQLFNKDAKPTACRLCHGAKGNGNGSLARRLDPPPRNFTCAEVMSDLPDGQLFWVIQNGSRGTAMSAHKSTLKPEEIWKLILFIKQFLKA